MKIRLLEEKKETKRVHLTLPYDVWTRLDEAIVAYEEKTRVSCDYKTMTMLVIEAGLNDREFWNQLKNKSEKRTGKAEDGLEEAA